MSDVQRLPVFLGETACIRTIFTATWQRFALLAIASACIGCESTRTSDAPRPTAATAFVDATEIFRRPRFGTAPPRDVASTGRLSSLSEDLEPGAGDGPRGVNGPLATADTAAMPAGPLEQVWTVVLAAFREPEQLALAAEMQQQLQAVPGLESCFVTTRGAATFVGVGSFADPGEMGAQKLLASVRAIQVGSNRPFGDSFFAPPLSGGETGARPEFNLLQARQQYGKRGQITRACDLAFFPCLVKFPL